MPDISVPEQRVCEMLSPLLASHAVGDAIGPRPVGNYLFSSLEFFLPEILRELHDEWKYESLDGLYARMFSKTGEHEIELVGITIFISDQTLTPIHLQLQLLRTIASLGSTSDSASESATNAAVNPTVAHKPLAPCFMSLNVLMRLSGSITSAMGNVKRRLTVA